VGDIRNSHAGACGDIDPKSGCVHASTAGVWWCLTLDSGDSCHDLVKVGNAGGVGARVAGIREGSFVVGDRIVICGKRSGNYIREEDAVRSILCRRVVMGHFRCSRQIQHSKRRRLPDLIDAQYFVFHSFHL